MTNKTVHYEHIITPEIAAAMLKTSQGNRPLRQWHVNYLAGLIQRGEWRMTHQGVAFDTKGTLRDGHHRLSAIVQAGIAVPMLVSDNMPEDSFNAVDQGVTRSLSDVTGMDKRVAEVVKAAARIVYSDGRPSVQQCYQVADAGVEDAAREVIEHCGTARVYFSSASIRLAAAYALLNGGDNAFVLGQYRALVMQEYESMTPMSRNLSRQAISGVANAKNGYETFHRGVMVFDESRRNGERVLATGDLITRTIETARKFFLDRMPAQPVTSVVRPGRAPVNEFLIPA